MIIPNANYPIPQQPTWSIHDSTKLRSFATCPRLYFFEYILGWKPDVKNIHLGFGGSWHIAQEHLLLNNYSPESVQAAHDLFCAAYIEDFGEDSEERHAPKNMANALSALIEYSVKYISEDAGSEVVIMDGVPLTEVAGAVLIDNDKELHFKLDSVMRDQRGIYCREHKTGSKDSDDWRAQWTLDIQPSIYTHVLKCMFPNEYVWGIEINGAIFRKKGNFLLRIPVQKTDEVMQTFMWNIIDLMETLRWEFERLAACKKEHAVMFCFPQRTISCTRFYRVCDFHPYCHAWQNPLQRTDPPPGYVVSHWDPREKEKTAKLVWKGCKPCA